MSAMNCYVWHSDVRRAKPGLLTLHELSQQVDFTVVRGERNINTVVAKTSH